MKQAKSRIKFFCKECGTEYFRWQGKCDVCGSWNSIQEFEEKFQDSGVFSLQDVHSLSDIRVKSGIPDLDLVLGGGFIQGSFILIGGEPGIGKSTLVLTIAENFARSGKKVLYFSGEESPEQIKLRAHRMKINEKNIYISRETGLPGIIHTIEKNTPDLVIIDSLQTIQTEEGSLPGTVSQLKLVAFRLMELAKKLRIPFILIGHITREGTIAGPKLLEHLVDTVLYFESDRLNHYRILRAMKNRFGNIGEVAIFEMTPEGLKAVSSFAGELPAGERPGCVYSVIVEGSRAIAVEVQALVTRTNYGPAKRMAEGLDPKRVILITAVIEKYLKISLSEQDIFANLAGGFIAHEPGLDLAIATAILSSYLEKSFSKKVAFLGEVGLTGEIRPIPRINFRLKELQNLGFDSVFIPASQKKEVDLFEPEILEIQHIRELTGVFDER